MEFPLYISAAVIDALITNVYETAKIGPNERRAESPAFLFLEKNVRAAFGLPEGVRSLGLPTSWDRRKQSGIRTGQQRKLKVCLC